MQKAEQKNIPNVGVSAMQTRRRALATLQIKSRLNSANASNKHNLLVKKYICAVVNKQNASKTYWIWICIC